MEGEYNEGKRMKKKSKMREPAKNKVQKCYTYQRKLLRFASRREQVPSMTFSHAPAVLIKRKVLQVQPYTKRGGGESEMHSVLCWGCEPSGGLQEMAPTLPILFSDIPHTQVRPEA